MPALSNAEVSNSTDGWAPTKIGTQPRVARSGEPQVAQGSALRVIAVIKLIKSTLLVAAGIGALGLLNATLNDSVVDLLHRFSLEHGQQIASTLSNRTASLLSSASPRRLSEVAAGCFVYGAIFLVEAAGLWTRKRWAEYMTVLVTASLLPFEIEAVLHRLTVERGVALLLNVAVVAYLVFHLWKQRRSVEDVELAPLI